MRSVIISNARILTLAGTTEARRGPALAELGVIERGWVCVEDGRIAAIEAGDAPATTGGDGDHIDADGAVLMPAFVDCHTHACWAGHRFDEFEMKLAGASYLDILKAGGGIMSTVRAVRDASQDELIELLRPRLARMNALGTGAVEIKSGYGLNTETELKMLRAIQAVADDTSMIIAPTFLGAHAIDPENPRFIDETIKETLPAVVEAFPGIPCDAYCEEGAWSLADTIRLFTRAQELGCPLRVHTDQFNSLGMTRAAIEMGARSVDHLEATTDSDIRLIADSPTIGVALPCSGFHLDDRYAPGRELVDAGAALAIATNYNPGSAPTPSVAFAITLACRKMRLQPAEAITAATYNAACVLGLEGEIGSIEVGKRADMQLLDCKDERDPGYECAGAGPQLVMINGVVVNDRQTSPPRL